MLDVYYNILITEAIIGSKLNGQPLGSDEHVSFWHIHLMKYHPAFDNKCSGY